MFHKDFKDIDHKESKFYIKSLPKFKGSISDCYEMYLTPYVIREEDELKNLI